MEATRNTRRIVSQIGFAALAFVIVKQIAGLVMSHYPLFPANGNPWLSYLAHNIPVYLFGVPAFLICMRAIPNGTDKRPKEQMGFSRALMIYFAGGGLGNIINSVIGVTIAILALFTPISHQTTISDLQGSGVSAAFAGLLLGACVAGFGEEFLFRKLLYKKMAGCPDILYILVSGITFGIMHTYFAQGIGSCFMGMAFAYIYLRTKNYLLIALLHIFTDTVALFFPPLLHPFGISAAIVTTPFLITGILVLIYAFLRYRKDIRKYLQPATESGWEFASGKTPLKAVFFNTGMALFTVWCLGNMIYNLF